MSETEEQKPATVVVPRRKWRFDAGARALTMTEPSGAVSTYPMSRLPPAALDYVAQLGMTLYLGKAEAPDAAFDKLAAGEFKSPKAEAKPKPVNHWRQAIAKAMQDVAKKAGNPLTDEEAATKAAALDVATVNGCKTDPAVVKHWKKLSGNENGGVAALLAA